MASILPCQALDNFHEWSGRLALDARADMATEPRTIKGPCFDCDDALDDAWEFCPCSRRGLRAERDTEPTPKLEPDELRPNVPSRLM